MIVIVTCWDLWTRWKDTACFLSMKAVFLFLGFGMLLLTATTDLYK